MGRHSEGKTPTIRALYPRHRSIARYVVAGATAGEISDIFGLTPGQVTRIINAPCFLEECNRLRNRVDDEIIADIRADLASLAPRAVEVLDEQMNYPGVPEAIKQKAAFDVLDRCGYGDKKPGAGGAKHLTLIKVEQNIKNDSIETIKDDVLDLVALPEE